MPLVIETGAIVEDANSYNTVAEIREYAEARGVVLPEDDSAVEVLAIKAMDYLNSKAELFVGTPVSIATQPLPWPRKDVTYRDGTAFPIDTIPKCLKDAESQLCIEQQNGIDLMPSVEAGALVVSEKLDTLQTNYSEKYVNTEPFMPAVNSLLAGLFRSGAMSLRTVRV